MVVLFRFGSGSFLFRVRSLGLGGVSCGKMESRTGFCSVGFVDETNLEFDWVLELLLQFVRTTDSKVHWFAFGWFVTKNLARGAALVDFVWRLCAGNFTVSCVDVLVLKTVLPFCQAVKVLAFLTMPLEASSKDANRAVGVSLGFEISC
ncbi:hypothetical protein Drorol1_Dr00013730 [Drosera rotundifolia]